MATGFFIYSKNRAMMPDNKRKTYYIRMLSLLILPCLFVVHHVQRFYPFVAFTDIFLPLMKYIGIVLLAKLIFSVLTKDPQKSDFLTFCWLMLYFFFKPAHDLIHDNFGRYFFAQYRYLLPIITVVFALVIWWVLFYSGNKRFSLQYAYTVAVIFMLIDIGWIVKKEVSPLTTGTVSISAPDILIPPRVAATSYPDILMLVFDELAGSAALQRSFGYDNTSLDKGLAARGFHIISHSCSNYYFTQFAMASMLNMSYLTVPGKYALEQDDYVGAMKLIRNNRVLRLLSSRDYSINNCTAFELEGYPAPARYLKNNFGTNQMDDGTIFNAIRKNIGWNFDRWRNLAEDTQSLRDDIDFSNAYHQTITALLQSASEKNTNRPQFTYAHFFYPHAPFLLDSLGRQRSASSMVHDNKAPNYTRAYLNYLTSVNQQILGLVEDLQAKQKRETIIIVMGDHGFRTGHFKTAKPAFFDNFMAITLPSRYARNFNDSISSVNLFRILFSNVFDTNIPLLSDSSFYLYDR
jgi:Sulfatase